MTSRSSAARRAPRAPTRRSRPRRSTPSAAPSPRAARPRSSRPRTTAISSCAREASPGSTARPSPAIRSSRASTPSSAGSRVRQRSGATVVTLDLGFPNVPVDAVEVQSSTDTFVRRAVVEGSNDGTNFVPLGSAEVARYRGVDLDRIPVDGRQRYVRVTDRERRRRSALGSSRRRARARPPARSRGGLHAAVSAPATERPAWPHRPTTSRGCLRTRSAWSARARRRSAARPSTRTSSLPRIRAPSSREIPTSSTGCSSSSRSWPLSAVCSPCVGARERYVAARFDLRKSLPPPSVLGGCDDSCSSGFFGFRSVGKILMTAYVIPAEIARIPQMYTTRSSRPRASSKAAVE